MDLVAALTGYSQTTRHIRIDTAMPGAFVVERFHGREGVNESFRFEIDVLSSEPFLDLTPLIGHAARLRLATGAGERSWNGYVTHAAYADSDGEITRYRLTMESWFALLRLRRNCLYFVDVDTKDICERVFGDYPQARWRYELKEPLRKFSLRGQYRETDDTFVLRQLAEAGLSFRIEHAQDAGKEASGDHTVVVFDRRAPFRHGSTIAYSLQDVGDPDGVITQFSERHQMVPDRVVATSWKADELLALAGHAQQPPEDKAPVLPVREIYDGQRAGRFDTIDDAQRFAEQRLDALRLPKRIHYGAGSSRTLEIGAVHTLAGYLDRAITFVPLSIEHEAVNNLGADIGALLGRGELDKGLYRNRFVAVPDGTPIVPPHRDRPIVHGVQTAIVVGEAGSRVSSTRDHQVRVQFPWMRGTAPLPGGLTDTASRSNPAGHAPGDHRSGVLARVAESSAGPNFGHAFTPRVGAEVVIGFESGNIDMPVVLGQVYGGRVQPPFAAGEGSDANHPGTLTGLQTQTLDGQSGSRWVMDDAAGQLRHELSNSTANSRLAQGYLIDQQGAMRGAYRGEGFELATDGWGVVRAGEGVLVSSTARRLATSTQMDVAQSVGQLKQAVRTAQGMSESAAAAHAGGLAANAAQADFLKAIDPAQDGKYTGAVNGQSATKASGAQRDGGEPVERFAAPAVLMESPENIVLTTPHSAVSYAAQHVHLTAQRDAHVAAAATVAAASGDAVSLYAAAGGLRAIASDGPVSVEAHTSTMEILADQSVRITSTDDRIDVLAKDSIVLQQGPNRITLKGGDITVETPGQFLVKSGAHPFPGPAAQSVSLPPLPIPAPLALFDEQIRFVNEDGEPLGNVAYQLKLADGSTVSGVTDDNGRTERVSTDGPTAIQSATLTPTQVVDCCGRTSDVPPPAVKVDIKGVGTHDTLVGSSEQSVTVKGESRPLTDGEIEMAKTVFQDSIDYSAVRVHKGSYFWFNLQSKRTAVTPNNTMYFREEDFVEDFSVVSEEYPRRGWFMHEMTHVWQHQRGYAVRWHALTVTIRGESAYRYEIEPGQVFSDFNMEQQGNLVSDYFALIVVDNRGELIHAQPGSKNQLRQVLAPLLQDPKDASNLPK
ncbi:type VI secretion system Vgr family protein [Burkholderia pseudomallei]|uniref:type VI secretion system Vgr family protein n=2 Tax=Burkholderia pseudomallei TaxID=28450 RepID=UPI000F04E061|nr:type VI secretion system Vgr family protein [Burkholderia pseudomallei]CAJ3822697.1 Rhs element Vgr protein [Burkholderia pseudomallei]CAJ4884675.1 Rhs element Vgr protein [Burkholderia pseudomallei]CAJ4890280.1 Rhs element Vgr protein [Burkholderia pseudomallei]CAJ5489204.1 Rhs element Vgr protein [Burkholderia pseudomallei]CAJ6139525.1 Rhs element Vgr protein [Burkholderia pseudomallei]